MNIRDIVKFYSKSVASYASHKYFYTIARNIKGSVMIFDSF